MVYCSTSTNSMRPYFQKLLCDSETPVSLYAKLAQHHPYAFLLESAEMHQIAGRYSFIGFDPLYKHIFPAAGEKNPLSELKKTYESIKYTPNPKLPKLQAGFVGYFSYEVARHFEKLPLPLEKAEIPEGIFFFPKNLLVFDHFNHTLTLITYSKKNLSCLLEKFKNIRHCKGLKPLTLKQKLDNGLSADELNNLIVSGRPHCFKNMVRAAKEDICAGETFQIVLSQLFQQKTDLAAFDIYRKLRLLSPSPYMYFLQYPDFSIIGSSPEMLVQASRDEIILRPIAGTRCRGKTQKEDCALEKELLENAKEQAEHMMLVDLGRNDAGRVAESGSVRVTRLMQAEKYSHVMHLVSEIRARRAKKNDLFDIFKTAFPAGTLAGAPKIRAMEIIAQLERKPRGIYGGAVGYFDLSGNMDFAIAIRTMVYKKGIVNLRAGAGIVYDSVPEYEHKECCNKARGPIISTMN